MGNHPSNPKGKIILGDGTVLEYARPLTVAELMLEYPQQVVVEFQNGRKPSPLPADTKLDADKVYMMLPKKRGLSSEEARVLLSTANSLIKSKSLISLTGLLPVFAGACLAISGVGEGRGLVAVRKEKKGEKKGRDEYYCLNMIKGGGGGFETGGSQVRAEYCLSRQVSGKGWKPSLDPIKEKNVETKISHWLV